MLNAVAEAVNIAKSMKQDIEDSAWFIWDKTRGAWQRGEARKAGKEPLLEGLNDLANEINSIVRDIGPHPFGTIKINFNKRTFLDRLLGRNKPLQREPGDWSLV